mgnify:CR=1 FL=1
MGYLFVVFLANAHEIRVPRWAYQFDLRQLRGILLLEPQRGVVSHCKTYGAPSTDGNFPPFPPLKVTPPSPPNHQLLRESLEEHQLQKDHGAPGLRKNNPPRLRQLGKAAGSSRRLSILHKIAQISFITPVPGVHHVWSNGRLPRREASP